MNVILTSLDLRGIASDGEVVLAPNTLVTPLAREDAASRGITLRVAGARNSENAGREAVASAAPWIVAARAVPVTGATSADELIRAVTEEVITYLSGLPGSQLGAERVEPGSPDRDGPPSERHEHLAIDAVAALIDQTILKPDASRADIERLCREAVRFGFASVCVNPWYVPLAVRLLGGSGVKVCTVVGFPLGATLPQIKMHEADEAIKLGAQEIDVVQNVGALKSGQDEQVEADLQGVVELSHRGGAACKVILETALLSHEEKVRAALIAKRVGADFVKTSTGFASGGATVEDVALLRESVGGEPGIKASGGIRTLDDLQAMVRAGATRIGTSAGVTIVEEARRRAENETPSSLPGRDSSPPE